ncbi:MAG: TonB-dependent receptor [Bacteroidales bacterium]|nr:TonB-dependent receptor [Bacteroidales bacterium]
MRLPRLLSFVMTLAVSAELYAQTNVKGTVLDSLSRLPEVGTVVQFIKSGEDRPAAYSVTDSLGKFERTLPVGGEYLLLLENMGRKPVRKIFSLAGEEVLDLGVILLQDDAQALDAAAVQAMKTLVKLDVNKLTYKVEADPDSKSGSVLDMLRKVPMVTVDGQDNITVNGSSNFKVYVDGKPNQMLSSNPSQILKAMPASAVKDIEVITNPGARYDAEGTGGVLNLITGVAAGASSAVSDGIYGAANLGVTTRGGNGSVYLSAKKNKLTVGVNAALGVQRLSGVTFSSMQENTIDGSSQSTEMVQKQKAPFLFTDLSASYEVSPRDLFSATIGLTRFNQTANGSYVVDIKGPDDYLYNYDQGMKYHSGSLNGSFDYQHTSDKVPGRVITLSYRYSGTPLETEVTNNFMYSPFQMPDRKSDGNDNSRENTVQLDLSTPIAAGHSLSSGLKYIARHNSADDKVFLSDGGAWARDTGSGMLYEHFNDIGAVYSEYTGTFGKLALTAGLRYEYTWQRVEYGSGYGHDFKTSFGDIVPNASVQYNLAPTRNLGLTYNRRIQRPGITYLNPYVDRSSTTNITYGNSDLTSARSDILSLVFNSFNPKWIVSLTGRYSHTGSGISSYSFYDADGMLNTTYGNVVVEDNTGVTAFVNWTAGPKTRLFTNSSAGFSKFSSDALDWSNHGWTWNAMLGVQQTLPGDILLSANVVANGRTWNLQGWSDGFKLGVLGLTKGFLSDKLKLTVQAVSNIGGDGLEIKSVSRGKDYLTSSLVTVPVRQVGVAITWNFGKQGFQVKKARRTIQNDDVINNSNGQAPGGSTPVTSGTGQLGI